ncbi:hypothetical protein MRX96_048690 [Rhipicephalus microplus]
MRNETSFHGDEGRSQRGTRDSPDFQRTAASSVLTGRASARRHAVDAKPERQRDTSTAHGAFRAQQVRLSGRRRRKSCRWHGPNSVHAFAIPSRAGAIASDE